LLAFAGWTVAVALHESGRRRFESGWQEIAGNLNPAPASWRWRVQRQLKLTTDDN